MTNTHLGGRELLARGVALGGRGVALGGALGERRLQPREVLRRLGRRLGRRGRGGDRGGGGLVVLARARRPLVAAAAQLRLELLDALDLVEVVFKQTLF